MGVLQQQTAITMPLVSYDFFGATIAQSTTGTLDVVASLAANGTLNVKTYTAPFAGSIVGVAGRLSGTPSAGTLTVIPTIDGVRASLSSNTTRDGAIQPSVYGVQEARVDRFEAGASLGLIFEADAAFEPNNLLDGSFQLFVLYEEVRV